MVRVNSMLGVFLAVGAVAACSGEAGLDDIQTQAQALFEHQPGPFPREGECNIDDPYFANVRHLIAHDNNIGPGTLKGVKVPEPENLAEFVRNRGKAIALGKALFWDMQVGSDGVQACGSCHFRAGADPRSRNQINPGGVDNPDTSFDHAPNSQLSSHMFPFHKVADKTDRNSAVLRDSDDVVSSQGVISADYAGSERGASHDESTPRPDAVFNINGVETRRAEPRNTPTMINAVFNLRQFWDGRADNIFNGVNPFGARDPNAQVLVAGPGGLEWTKLRIDNASLASQAVGPILSDREMGFFGRPLRDVGRRLVSAEPLRLQQVHPQDSVLGSYVDRDGRGLRTTYETMIREAFETKWWRSDTIVVVNPTTQATSFAQRPRHRELRDNEYSMMEWNFSLFFGLAVQMYEATLVSDDAKVDRHFDRLKKGKPGILTQDELDGMELMEESACFDCHSGPEFMGAGVRGLKTGFENPAVSPSFQVPEQIERMVIGSCEIAMYDQGFYNLGVRPTHEDLGLGGFDPFGNPLSIAKLLTTPPDQVPSQELLTYTYPSLMSIGRTPPIQTGERTAVAGTFKMPSLRNVALTAPYFHNGGTLTLRQVVEFYNRGGDFHDQNDANMALGIGKLNLTEQEIDKIVAFLHTLTDERVAEQRAPFDHPELFVPNGHIGNEHWVLPNLRGQAVTQFERIPQVGRNGGPLPKGFLEH